MKKVLFATTALVGFAGAAAADIDGPGENLVSFTGSAEMGIKYFDNGAPAGLGDGTIRFHHDLDLDIDMSGSTDSGLSFGASVDLDEVPSGLPDDSGPVAVFISGDFGTLTIGDTDGAFDKALTEVAAGNTLDDEPEHQGWSGNGGLDGLYDGQVLRYDYSFSVLTFSLSGELDDLGTADPVIGVGVEASSDLGGVDVGIGLGYQQASDGTTDLEIFGASLSASIGDFTGIVNYTDGDSATGTFTFESGTYVGVSLEYSFGDLNVGANYGTFEGDTGFANRDGFGIWADYDLGGGAVFTGGIGISETEGANEVTAASIGMKFSF